MTNIHGYRVLTDEGKAVGTIAGESAAALVVERGFWPRKSWRALPKQFASIDAENRSVLMQVPKDMLALSPRLKRGVPVDDSAVASWWGLEGARDSQPRQTSADV